MVSSSSFLMNDSAAAAPTPTSAPVRSSSDHTWRVARHSGGFCSGHVLVNYERQLRKLPSLKRSRTLDRIASQEAQALVDAHVLQQQQQELSLLSSCSSSSSFLSSNHSGFLTSVPLEEDHRHSLLINENHDKDSDRTCFIAKTVLHGHHTTIRRLHAKAMHRGNQRCRNHHKKNASDRSFRRHVLSSNVTELGLATVHAPDGSLFMVLLFRGTTTTTTTTPQAASTTTQAASIRPSLGPRRCASESVLQFHHHAPSRKGHLVEGNNSSHRSLTV